MILEISILNRNFSFFGGKCVGGVVAACASNKILEYLHSLRDGLELLSAGIIPS